MILSKHNVSGKGAGRQGGFTLLELMVGLSIMAIVLAAGIPYMSSWIYANKVASAAHFYAEGLSLARNQALTHNSASRLVLVANAGRQSDWRVDICYPTPAAPCTATSSNWSTTTTAAAGDPETTGAFKSVLRTAESLPPSTELVQTIAPEGASSVQFTPLGWVDRSVGTPITRITLAPVEARASATPAVAVALTMAGIPIRCKPTAANTDRMRCP